VRGGCARLDGRVGRLGGWGEGWREGWREGRVDGPVC
jgi:hypothetical protein